MNVAGVGGLQFQAPAFIGLVVDEVIRPRLVGPRRGPPLFANYFEGLGQNRSTCGILGTHRQRSQDIQERRLNQIWTAMRGEVRSSVRWAGFRET
jgi:hypothetical protein